MRNFADLFKGREDAYGQYGNIRGVQPSDRGKHAAPAKNNRTVSGVLTPEIYQLHLAGKKRLGIVMLMADSHVWFAAIDVDHYQTQGMYEEIAARIKELGLPLVLCRSKSNGAHLFVFFSKPCPGDLAIKSLLDWANRLNLPHEHVDYFPRQKNATDVGNWINLPYYGDTCRWFDGEDHSIDEFIEYANAHLVDPDTLQTSAKGSAKKKVKEPVSPYPPCIDWLHENGLEEGQAGRNDILFHYSVGMKRAHPDDWQDRVREFNADKVSPPLDRSEVATVINSIERHESYQYKCEAMKALYCDKTECKKREFGVGKAVAYDPIDHIEKIDGEKPLFVVTMDDEKHTQVICTFEEMTKYPLFRYIAGAAMNQLLPGMKNPDWEEIVSPHISTMEISKAGADTQMRDRVIKQFQSWCEMSVVVEAPIETALHNNGNPWFDGKNIYFRGNDFCGIVESRLRLSRQETWLIMRDWGCIPTTMTIEGKKEPLWCYVVRGPLWFEDKLKREKQK